MRKMVVYVVMFMVCSTSCISAEYSLLFEHITASDTSLHAVGGGWLEERDGIKILHLTGSHYEMGYQHGMLLKNETQQNLRAYLYNSPVPYEDLLDMWNETKPYIPDEYIQEMQGLADGAGISMEEVAAAYMAVLRGAMGCFGVAAWGPATEDGRLYHARSFDLPMDIQDPVSGKYVHENSVLIVRNPENGYASLSPSVAGSMHGGGGINEQGMALGTQTCWSNDQTLRGTPVLFRVQMVLDHAATAEEAFTFLLSNSTLGWNFILSDAKVPVGYAVEVTANHSYVGTFDNLVESTHPFWSLDHMVRRTNFFIDPATAATQRPYYDPSGIRGFVRIFTENDIFFVVWRSYKAMSELFEQHWGTLTFNSTMALMRKGYRGDTDFLLKMLIILTEGTSFNRAWNMWVACPETGDMVVSFAERNTIAFDTPCHYVNLYQLLHEEPPP
ncbi:MAG TPA: hypothetical protein ENG06_05330 [Thermoplasmatales archaeon]|nr:hypothetical protein [Thermoplasmatales archaeon]